VIQEEHTETPVHVVDNTDSQTLAASDAQPDLSGIEEDFKSLNQILENKGTELAVNEEEVKPEDIPEETEILAALSADTTTLQDSNGSQSAGDVHSLHVQEAENVGHNMNGHIALESGKSDIQPTEPVQDQPEANQEQNENSVENSSKLPEEQPAEIDSSTTTQQHDYEIEWGQSVDAENGDLFGQNGGQEQWGNGDFLESKDDITEERPDPEAQEYTLFEERDDHLEDHQDPEIGHTSADVHDAEPDDAEGSYDPFAEPSQQQNKYDDERVAAFSQIQGHTSESSNALEFVAHQLVDPSNPVPQDMAEESSNGSNENSDGQQSNNWWENAGSSEVFDFSALETEGGFDDAFDPTKGTGQLLPATDDPFADIVDSNNGGLDLEPLGSKGTHWSLLTRAYFI